MAGASGAHGAETDDIEKAIKEADDRERGGVSGTDVALANRQFVFAFKEIKNVLRIEKDPLYNAALKEWDRKEAYLGKRVDRRELTSANLVNQIFNIVGFFSVFQGVVLTAVSQLKSDTFSTCGLVWFPVVLTSAAAVVSIVGVTLKFLNLAELEKSILLEKLSQTEASSRAHRLRGDGKEVFRFYRHTKEPDALTPKSFHFSWFCVVLLLVLFTVLFILSYFAILCNLFAIRAWKGGLNWP